jgi:uncharacterized protein YciI
MDSHMSAKSWLVLWSVVLAAGAGVPAQENAEPKYEMTTYHWVFLVRGANHPTLSDAERETMQKGHIANLERLGREGKGLMAGPLGDNGRIRGIAVLDVKSEDEARREFSEDPYVKSGIINLEIHKWFTAKDRMKKPNQPVKMKPHILCILKKGPAWTAETTPETAKIQEGHMANIRHMAELGDLALAGPLAGAEELRGIFVFRIDSEEKVKTLVAEDPAIKTGRLALELHPLYLADGVLAP